MSKQIYTITELTKELNQARHNIRRRLDMLGIKAVNEDNRAYKTQPLKYDNKALAALTKEFELELSPSDSNNYVKGVTTDVQADHRLIEQLQEDLKHERERTSNLERLLSQQQQLSLSDRNKIKVLEIELAEVSDSKEISKEVKEEKVEEKKKSNWYEFWK